MDENKRIDTRKNADKYKGLDKKEAASEKGEMKETFSYKKQRKKCQNGFWASRRITQLQLPSCDKSTYKRHVTSCKAQVGAVGAEVAMRKMYQSKRHDI